MSTPYQSLDDFFIVSILRTLVNNSRFVVNVFFAIAILDSISFVYPPSTVCWLTPKYLNALILALLLLSPRYFLGLKILGVLFPKIALSFVFCSIPNQSLDVYRACVSRRVRMTWCTLAVHLSERLLLLILVRWFSQISYQSSIPPVNTQISQNFHQLLSVNSVECLLEVYETHKHISVLLSVSSYHSNSFYCSASSLESKPTLPDLFLFIFLFYFISVRYPQQYLRSIWYQAYCSVFTAFFHCWLLQCNHYCFPQIFWPIACVVNPFAYLDTLLSRKPDKFASSLKQWSRF